MEFIQLAQTCAATVAPSTLAAIVRTESRFQPLAIGVNGGSRLARQPRTKEEAVVTARWLLKRGYSIDLGLGQINSRNLLPTSLSVEDAFDPCKNLTAAAALLTGQYRVAQGTGRRGQAALHAALSAYNTGSLSRGFTNGYVQRVVASAQVLQGKPAIVPIPLLPAGAPVHRAASTADRAGAKRNQPVPAATGPATAVYGHDNPPSNVYR